MPISGSFKRRRTYVDEASPLGGASPELHMRTDYIEPGSRPPYAAPRQVQVPTALTDSGQGYDEVRPRDAPGLLLDQDPVTHDDGMPGTSGRSLDRARRAGNRARSVDRGRPGRQRFVPTRARAANEGRETNRLGITPTSNGSRIAPFRGRNSLPENNPEGYRYGYRVQRWMTRPFWTRWRRHDLRPISTQLAAAAVSSPAPVDGNRYTSPFDWGVSSRRRVQLAPLVRRAPRPWDEDVTDDGMDQGPPAEFQSWGL